MKYGWMLGALLVPYSALVPQSPGNPNGDAYIGQPGSVYDSAANPPKTNGVVTYNPMAPLPPQAADAPPPPLPMPAPGTTGFPGPLARPIARNIDLLGPFGP